MKRSSWTRRVMALAGGLLVVRAVGADAGVSEAPVSAQGSPAADTGYFQIVRPVDRGVWLLTEPKFQLQPIGNVTVVEQRDGLVLVDAGGSPGSGRRIVQMVKSLSPKPVKAVIISQWHGDKAQGLSEILKVWPTARTISTAVTQKHLADPATMNTPGSPDAARNAKYEAAIAGEIATMKKAGTEAKTAPEREGSDAAARMLQQYAPDMDGALTLTTRESFTDRLTISDPETPVEAMFLGRANTDGDALVWLPRQRILIAGEVVILPFPYGFGSYPAEWIQTLDKVRAMDFRVLIPGHGMAQTDRKQIDRHIAALIATLKDVRAQVAPLVAKGLTLEEVHAKVDLGPDAKAFIGDDPWTMRWFKQFFADPIITSAYKEARGEPIVQNLRG